MFLRLSPSASTGPRLCALRCIGGRRIAYTVGPRECSRCVLLHWCQSLRLPLTLFCEYSVLDHSVFPVVCMLAGRRSIFSPSSSISSSLATTASMCLLAAEASIRKCLCMDRNLSISGTLPLLQNRGRVQQAQHTYQARNWISVSLHAVAQQGGRCHAGKEAIHNLACCCTPKQLAQCCPSQPPRLPGCSPAASRPLPERFQTACRPLPYRIRILTTRRPLPGCTKRFQTASQPLPDRCQLVSKPLPDRLQTASKPLPVGFQTAFRPLADRFPGAVRPLPGFFQAAGRPLPDCFQAKSRPCPDRFPAASRHHPLPGRFQTASRPFPDRFHDRFQTASRKHPSDF